MATVRKIALYTRVIFTIYPYLVFIMFLLARMDDKGYSWGYTFIPLFIADVVHVCGYVSYLWLVIKQKWLGLTWTDNVCFTGAEGQLLPVILVPLILLTKVAAEILILLYLLSVMSSFIPCGICMSLCFALISIGMTIQSIKTIIT